MSKGDILETEGRSQMEVKVLIEKLKERGTKMNNLYSDSLCWEIIFKVMEFFFPFPAKEGDNKDKNVVYDIFLLQESARHVHTKMYRYGKVGQYIFNNLSQEEIERLQKYIEFTETV
jgi:hypothetical protein